MDAHAALWCKSNFSFLEGASHAEELVERAHELGLAAIALTDRGGVYGMPRAWERARELGVKLIAGAEVALEDVAARVVLLATDREGWGNLCRLLTRGRLRCEKGEYRLASADVLECSGGLLALMPDARALAVLHGGFGDRTYAMVARHRRAEEVEAEAALRECAARLDVPVVAATEVLYHTPARRPLQDVLTCIRHGVKLQDAGRATRPNAEHALLGGHAFRARFQDDLAAVLRTREVAERCTFTLEELRYRYPSEALPDGTTSAQWLRQLAHDGARRRWPDGVPAAITQQLDVELDLIEELDYPGYFLTMWEIVRYCERHGILCQGRGSAANSAVCYCLGVTAVDPTKIDLLFERFLSKERHEPPDIDLDIAHERREEVIQWVYRKYGRDRAAMVANVIRYRKRSAIRDVGKALGMAETALDRLAKLASRWGELDDTEALLRDAGLDSDAPVHRHFVALVEEVLDFPRHLSIHPGGFLLGHEPVDRVVPIENGAMAERTVIQWDKDDLEALGLFKVDLLGLGALTMVDRCFHLLRAHKGIDLELATIPAEDPATYDMVCRGDTLGTFQIESRAQMAMLPRLRPRTFYDLVIEVSIVRPGPIAGDMVHPYLRRRRGEEAVTFAHPSLRPVLEKTLGVPLFQEQVMKLAMVAADYSPGEADQLRRDMAAWRRGGRIERHRVRIVERMRSKGIDEEFATRVFEQIRGFGEYGFPESHAASFALIAYATAWLRCHHVDAFACALLNSQPMGFYAPSTIVEDAKRQGVEVRPIDVTVSEWDCTLEEEPNEVGRCALRMGLRYVKGLREAVGRRLVVARDERPFAGLRDLRQRAGLDHGELTALAEVGALEAMVAARRQALWEVWRLSGEPSDRLPLETAETAPAFAELAPLEIVAWDHRRAEHSPRAHPLAHLRAELRLLRLPTAAEVATLPDGRGARFAGLVICRQRPGTAKGILFMTLEDETGFVNVVVWQRVFERNAALIKTEPFLAVQGKLQNQDGVVHIIARRLWVPRLAEPPASVRPKDFR